jgi:hypothetical protein
MAKKGFRHMCDKCFKIMDISEMYSIKIVDDYEETRVFSGHAKCMNELRLLIKEGFGIDEE